MPLTAYQLSQRRRSIGASEAAVALAIIIAMNRVKGGITLDDATELRG